MDDSNTLGTRLQKFYNDISQAGYDASGVFNNIADHSKLDATLTMLDNCSNNLFNLWNINAQGNDVVFLKKDIPTNNTTLTSVEEHFINWCQLKEASGGPVIDTNSSITWEQLDGSGDIDLWGGKILSPTGDILNSNQQRDIDNEKVSTQQLIRIVYELMLLNNREKTNNFGIQRSEIIRDISGNYPGFLQLPEIWNQKDEIKNVKKYIIMFYVMVKSNYSESDVNTGLLFN